MITLKTNEAFIFFACSLILGLSLGLIYDLFRALRLNFKGRAFAVITDILFFLICAVRIYLFSIAASFGEIRLFIIFGIVSSLVLEQITLAPFITKIFKFFIGIMKSFIVFLLLPLKRLMLFIIKELKDKIFSNFHKKLLKNRPRLLYNTKRSLRREKRRVEENEKYFS